jgi:hypothetical protein
MIIIIVIIVTIIIMIITKLAEKIITITIRKTSIKEQKQ